MISKFIDYPVISEANNRDHWTRKRARRQQMQFLLKSAFADVKISLPCEVTFERCSPRVLDETNLIYAFKSHQDTMADIIIANALGVPYIDSKGRNDSNAAITWKYGQIKHNKKGFWIHVK
jgi:hypothetical protein